MLVAVVMSVAGVDASDDLQFLQNLSLKMQKKKSVRKNAVGNGSIVVDVPVFRSFDTFQCLKTNGAVFCRSEFILRYDNSVRALLNGTYYFFVGGAAHVSFYRRISWRRATANEN